MSRRKLMRDLRKEMLLLQAEQLRLALREEFKSVLPSAPHTAPSWGIGEFVSLLGAIFPGKTGRWLRVALAAWRLGKKLVAERLS